MAARPPPPGLRGFSAPGLSPPTAGSSGPDGGCPFGKPPALGVAPSSCDRTLFTIGIDKKWTRARRQGSSLRDPGFSPCCVYLPPRCTESARYILKAWRAHWPRSPNINTKCFWSTSYVSSTDTLHRPNALFVLFCLFPPPQLNCNSPKAGLIITAVLPTYMEASQPILRDRCIYAYEYERKKCLNMGSDSHLQGRFLSSFVVNPNRRTWHLSEVIG